MARGFFFKAGFKALDQSIKLDHATKTFLEHFHQERSDQGSDNELILKFEQLPDPTGEIEVRERLGGLLKSYRRAVA